MVTLLSLPQELRDYVLLYAVVTGTNASQLSDDEDREKFREPQDLTYKSRVGSMGIFYRRMAVNTTRSLLLTNRQLKAETEVVLRRYHDQHGNHYGLDVILDHEQDLYCTWTEVPPPRQQVDSLAVTFRIQGMSRSTEQNGFTDNPESTGSSVWRLYSIVERFMRCGALSANRPDCDRGFSLEALQINVATPDMTHPANQGLEVCTAECLPDRISQHRAMAMKTFGTNPGVMHPDALAQFIFIWIEGLLRMSDPEYALPGAPLAKYGKILLERLGRVHIEAADPAGEGGLNKEYSVLVKKSDAETLLDEQRLAGSAHTWALGA